MSKPDTVSVDDAIAYLNELIELDRSTIAALIANRIPCNRALADHQTAQCGERYGGFTIGMIGVLNGLFGVDDDGWGFIAFVFEDGNLQRVVRRREVADEQ